MYVVTEKSRVCVVYAEKVGWRLAAFMIARSSEGRWFNDQAAGTLKRWFIYCNDDSERAIGNFYEVRLQHVLIVCSDKSRNTTV